MERRLLIKGPPFEARLSPLDGRFVALYSRRLFIFKPADNGSIVTALERGVRKLVQQVPVLGGIVDKVDKVRGQSGWNGIQEGPGLEVIIRDISKDLTLETVEAQDFQPAALPDDLLVPVTQNYAKEPYPSCKMQLSLTTDGAILAICVAHVVGDGPGISEIIRLLADHCRAAQEATEDGPEVPQELRVGLDRTCYAGLKGSRNRIEDHPAYAKHTQPGVQGSHGETTQSTTEAHSHNSPPRKTGYAALQENLPSHDNVIKMYSISERNLQDLKAAASTITRISTHDALSALMWRSIIINRLASKVIDRVEGAESSFILLINTRRYMNVGERYIGNTVYHTYCTISLDELLSTSANGLSAPASRIRAAINSVSRESVTGHVDMIERLPDLTEIRWAGMTHALTRDIACTSFYHTETMYTSEWGPAFGRVVRMRSSDLGFTNAGRAVHFIMPREEGRGCEVQLSVEREGIAAMENDELFGRYFSTKSLAH